MDRPTTFLELTGELPEIASLLHDLRNPLSTISASAEVLIGTGLSEPQIHRVARNLYGASVRMKELLDEVFNCCGRTNGGLTPCDIRELVTSAVDKVALVADSQSVKIVQNIPESMVITLDRQRIERVLLNLLVNALDVMPRGGYIRVSAVLEPRAVLIKVRDTGPGIDPEIQHLLFQPFATSSKPRGLGLGLAFSRQTVLDHGGKMWVETGGQGACFAFCLPSTRSVIGQSAIRENSPFLQPYRPVRHVEGAPMNLMNEVAGGTNLQLTEAASNVTRIAMERERSQTTLDQAPDAAARSEGQLRKIIDTIPTLVWRSLPDGRLDYLNQRWLDYTGLSLEQAHDCGWLTIVHPDDVDRVTSQWLPEVLTSGQPGATEVRLRRFDGGYRWFLMRIAPFRDETGSAVHWYGTNTDIEDRKRAEEKVREDDIVGGGGGS